MENGGIELRRVSHRTRIEQHQTSGGLAITGSPPSTSPSNPKLEASLSSHPDNYIVETGAARPACPPEGQTERPPHDDEQPSDSTEPRRGWLEKFRFVHIIDATGGDIRDHLALERTWLAYNRTANTLASYAVVVAQLFILHEHKRTLGRVCGVIMICGAILIDLVSALRICNSHMGLQIKALSQGRVEPCWERSVWLSVLRLLAGSAWDCSFLF